VAGGHLSIDRIVLAAPTTRVSVRAIDLDDADASSAELANEAGRVGAGRLNAD
jgi:hypothetical protein